MARSGVRQALRWGVAKSEKWPVACVPGALRLSCLTALTLELHPRPRRGSFSCSCTLVAGVRGHRSQAHSDFVELEERLRASDDASRALRRDLDGALKELHDASKQHGKREASLDDAFAKLGRKHTALDKELSSGLAKAASERATLRSKVDGLVSMVRRISEQM